MSFSNIKQLFYIPLTSKTYLLTAILIPMYAWPYSLYVHAHKDNKNKQNVLLHARCNATTVFVEIFKEAQF